MKGLPSHDMPVEKLNAGGIYVSEERSSFYIAATEQPMSRLYLFFVLTKSTVVGHIVISF